MDENSLILALLAAAGAAVGLAAAVARWRNAPPRRLRRGLGVILGHVAEAVVVAPGCSRGIGFSFTARQVAVGWNGGAWGFRYGLDELKGAQIIVDGRIVGFASRGAARRLRDLDEDAERRVALRLFFDDPAYPHFVLDLWRRADDGRHDAPPPEEAVAEAARWLVRIDELLNRPRRSWWEPPQAADPQPPAIAKAEPRPLPAPRQHATAYDDRRRDEHAA